VFSLCIIFIAFDIHDLDSMCIQSIQVPVDVKEIDLNGEKMTRLLFFMPHPKSLPDYASGW
jgi:hypothetical protein